MMFGSKHKKEIAQRASMMADIITGVYDGEISDDGSPALISPRDDFAYLQGYRIIEHLRLGTFNTRRLINGFKSALVDNGLSTYEIDVHTAQFWVYYWTMMVGSTAEIGGMAYRFTLKRLRQSKATLDRIKQQNG